jgi:predicted RNase H-like HicB family nuclease
VNKHLNGRQRKRKTKGTPAMKIKAVIHPAEEGGFWAEVPVLKGCYSEGDTFEETLANIREAAEGWLEVAAEQTAASEPALLAEIEL